MTAMRDRIAIAFFVSNKRGSDYRVGFEYLSAAIKCGFNKIIVANLKGNNSEKELNELFPDTEFIIVRSLVCSHESLQKFTDFFPHAFWHYSVSRYIKSNFDEVDAIWITTSSAQPWFPLKCYKGLARKTIWGPIGGGDYPPDTVLSRFSYKVRIRENIRKLINEYALKTKIAYLKTNDNIVVMARTSSIQLVLSECLKDREVRCFPEFLEILKSINIQKEAKKTPIFVWAGQNIARKDLELGISVFNCFRLLCFPDAKLHVYGVDQIDSNISNEIKFYGWVDQVPWHKYKDDGVLIISSFREGLSTVLVEALSNGLLCVANPVGAIAEFRHKNLMLLPKGFPVIPNRDFLTSSSRKIDHHLNSELVSLERLDYRENLINYINCQLYL